MKNILDIIADWLDVPQVFVALSRPPNTFEIIDCRDDSWPGLQVGHVINVLESDVLPDTFTATDNAVTFSDRADSQYVTDSFLQNAAVSAFLGIALRDEAGVSIGVLAVLTSEPRSFSDKDKNLLHAMNAAVVQGCRKNRLFDKKPEIDNLNRLEFYRALVEGGSEGISVLDLRQQRVIFRNKAARESMQQACGLTGAAMYSEKVEDFSPEFQQNGQRSTELARKYLDRAVAGEPLTFDWLYRHSKTGELTPAEMKLIRLSNAEPHLIRITCADISNRVAAEQRLRESEENLRITLSSIGDGVIATDSNGCVVRINPVAEQLTGWHEKEAKGKPLTDIFNVVPSDKRKPTENILTPVFTENKTIEMVNSDYRLVARDATERNIVGSAAPILNTNEEFAGVVLVFRDATREQQLRQMITRAEKMSAIGQLSAGIAHDFNNILATISGALDLEKVRHPSLFETPLLKFSQRVESSIQRGKDLTERMLFISTEQGQQVECIDLLDVIDGAASILQSSFDKRIRVTKEINTDDASVMGEASVLENAILNIGINSAHAMPEGGQIKISLDRAAKRDLQAGQNPDNQAWLRLSVTDTGVGIAPENLPRIFEPFYTTKGSTQGTGLGLAMVYATAEQLGGYVEASSEPDHGTTISLYLPKAQTKAPKSPPPIVETSGAAPQGRTVLFVDDEPLIRETYGGILEDFGCKVILASDGEEAVRLFAQNKDVIELILMDLSMPKMTGDQAAKEIRKLSSHCPIVICTGHVTNELKQTASSLAIARILKKPFEVKCLKEVLTELSPT